MGEKMENNVEKILDFKPEVGLILGSGLGDYGEKLENPEYIEYCTIEGFPVSKVDGHKNRFILGKLYGKRIIAMQGRFHYYEGIEQRKIAIPIHIMKDAGVKVLILTNAAGGVNTSFKAGDLMVLTDHINLSGSNPLRGENDEKYGSRFPDMSQIYDRELRERLLKEMEKKGINLEQGVYAMNSGPQYETPAEVKMLRILGADAVGMSTVPEAILARHCGMKVIGISCITNMAAGILEKPLNHIEVCETAQQVKSIFESVIDTILKEVI